MLETIQVDRIVLKATNQNKLIIIKKQVEIHPHWNSNFPVPQMGMNKNNKGEL